MTGDKDRHYKIEHNQRRKGLEDCFTYVLAELSADGSDGLV